MKYLIVLLAVCLFNSNCLIAQSDTIIHTPKTKDTFKVQQKKITDSTKTIKKTNSTTTVADTSIKINDTVKIIDTLINLDSSKIITVPIVHKNKIDTSTFDAIIFHKYFPLKHSKVYMLSPWQHIQNKDVLFYSLVFLVAFLAIIKLSFSKYFSGLFKQLLQQSNKQRQTQEQIIQNNFPSLLLNFLFVLSGGMFIALLAFNKHWVQESFWLLFLYSTVLLIIIYGFKYIFLLFFGWLFNLSKATDTYTFIVFLINKILGIIFIPILFIIAFSPSFIAETVLSITIILLTILFLYRYWLSFLAIRNNLKVSAFHFFLYLCAIEILPLAILYKAVFKIIQG